MNAQAEEVLDIETETETEITDDDALEAGADRGDDFNPTTDEVPAEAAAAEPAAAETPEAEDDAAQAARMIPKSRFDEVNNAKKLAEQENQRLLNEIEALRKGGEAPAEVPAAAEPAPEIADLERQKFAAMLEGDEEKVVELGMKINNIIRAESKREALNEIKHDNAQATTAQAVSTAASAVIGKYPAFDDSHADANQEAIEELVELRDFYITAKGMTPAEAIIKAGDKVAKLFGFADGPAAPVAPAAPVVDPRTVVAIKRGAAITEAQPSTAAVGVGTRLDGGSVNIADMTEDQFDALPEAEKRRARGD